MATCVKTAKPHMATLSETETEFLVQKNEKLTILARIIVPISIPIIATVSLFFIVGYWNDYINSRLYLTRQTLFTLQTYLRSVIFDARDPFGSFSLNLESMEKSAPQTIINATIIAAIVPIALAYPFLQRYFIHGIMVGSVKE
jgi:putative aldouronate transport system permease protein